MSELNDLKKKLEEVKDTDQLIFCTIEEMSETTKVLTKYLRKSSKFSKNDLIEEISHSLMTLEAVKNRFKISDKEINDEQLSALRRFIEKEK